MLSQLPLNISLRDDATLDSFFSGDNQEILQAVRTISMGAGDNFLYLWGQQSVGCTHLLQAACQATRDLGLPAAYLPLKEMISFPVQNIQGFENIALICIDDIQCIAGNAVWEEAIFHLFNRIRLNHTRLLMGAKESPHHIKIQLPDLKSRLSWGITYHLQPLTDEQKLDALSLRSQNRGLKLDKAVGQFLLSRCPRNMTELFQTLKQLDEASLISKRRLTIPFVKEVLWGKKI